MTTKINRIGINSQNDFAIATFARIEMRGMTMMADPRFEIIPPREISSPVVVSFKLKEGEMKGGKPASMLPVKIKLE